ncbi:TspO/MBR family protein [Clostridium sp. BJN0001]|uniref:TspO/MBR family protein n=1 Tax=Clostridium sp. BJN0001 TaxID=2930219 RepID=UPI001FD0C277|nr:TspO/MBR family protein [Clostridium sp. BJN0001]
MKNKVSKETNILDLIILTFLPLFLSGIVSFIISDMKNIYQNIKKPFFSPPGFIFPIVWTILYILMGYASYRIYKLKKHNIDVSSALFVYFIQLGLNMLWPILFFGLRLYGLAFIEIIILILFIIFTIYRFYKKDGVISLILLLPYFVWTIYASVLNFYIWMLNEM